MTVTKIHLFTTMAALALMSATMLPHSAAAQSVGNIFATSTVNLTVKKNVIGGTAVPSDFLIHVLNKGADVVGSPQAGSATGTVYAISLTGGTDLQVVEQEGGPVGYDVRFNGDCDDEGHVILQYSQNVTCTVTNAFIGTSTPRHHHDGDVDNNNSNTNLNDLLLLLLAGRGFNGGVPGILVPTSCTAPSCPPGTTNPGSTSQAPGVPNTGSGGNVAENVFMLLASVGVAFAARAVARRV